jgi:hypothetical protein
METITRRVIDNHTRELLLENPLLTNEQAQQQSKEELLPTVILAIISQLPLNIIHRSGDRFYPDQYCRSLLGTPFAYGRLDDDFAYHLWHANGDSHYDLYREEQLIQLVDKIIKLGMAKKLPTMMVPTYSEPPEGGSAE